MTIALITGITGQDGSYLAERLLHDDVTVHGLVLPHELSGISESVVEPVETTVPVVAHARDRAGTPVETTVPVVPVVAHARDRAGTRVETTDSADSATAMGSENLITYHVGDLADPASIAAVVAQVQPDVIFNLGGLSSVAFSWEHPTLVGQVCGLGAVAIMEAAFNLQAKTGKSVKIIQASSAEIFGNPEQVPQTETTPIRPVNPYGTAKAYAHLSAAVFRSRGLPVSTVILYNHESPRRPETFVTRKITAQVARIARDGGGTLSLGNLESRRDWGWAPDYVDAMLLVAAQPEADDYLIATGESHSVGEFAEAAFAQVGIDNWRDYVVVDPNLVRPAEAALQVGDATKARVRLGWRPTVGFAELVGRMVDNDVALLDKGEKP